MLGSFIKLVGLFFLSTWLGSSLVAAGLLTVGVSGGVFLLIAFGLLLVVFFVLPLFLWAAMLMIASVVVVTWVSFFPVFPWLLMAAVVALLWAFYRPRSYREVSFD